MLNPSVVLRGLGILIGVLVLAGIVSMLLEYQFGHPHVQGLVETFSLDGEGTAGAYFSSIQLLIAAGLLTVLARAHRDDRREARYWAVLAVGFFLMSADEAIGLHEKLAPPVRELLGERARGVFYFPWVIPAAAGVGALGIYFVPFVLKLPQPTRAGFVFAGVLFVGGAVVVEALEGRYVEAHGSENLGFHGYVVVEETMEMTGIWVFIRTLLGRLAAVCDTVVVTFRPPASSDVRVPGEEVIATRGR